MQCSEEIKKDSPCEIEFFPSRAAELEHLTQKRWTSGMGFFPTIGLSKNAVPKIQLMMGDFQRSHISSRR